jgi:hypothetical protein
VSICFAHSLLFQWCEAVPPRRLVECIEALVCWPGHLAGLGGSGEWLAGIAYAGRYCLFRTFCTRYRGYRPLWNGLSTLESRMRGTSGPMYCTEVR